MPQSQMMQASYGSTVYGFQTGFKEIILLCGLCNMRLQIASVLMTFYEYYYLKSRGDRRATSRRPQDYRKLTV